MTRRKGLGAGRGKGYKNILPTDKRVHAQSARGVKQPQKVPAVNFMHKGKPLASISQDGLFAGEIKETKDLLAHEKGIDSKDIKATFDVFYDGEDDWGRKVYVTEGGAVLKDVDGVLHTTTKGGEPSSPIRKDLKPNIIKKPNKNLPAFVNNKELKEKEVLLLKRRLNDGKITPDEIFGENFDKAFRLTDEQEKKGLKWLNNLRRTKTGAERENNPFGAREEYVLDNFDRFELVDFYDNANYYQAQVGRHNYQPLYEVVAKDGSSFQYWQGYDRGSDFPIQIVG